MKSHALSFKYLIKRVLKEFAGKPVYTLVTVVVLTVLTAATMLLATFASYSSERVIANALTEGQTAMVYQYIKEDPVGWGADGTSIYARLINDDEIDGVRLYYDDEASDGAVICGVVESAEELLELGYEFEGEYLPLEADDDFYYTDYALAVCGYVDVKAGDEVVWDEFGNYKSTVKGVIKTDYKDYIKFKEEEVDDGSWTLYIPRLLGKLSEREQTIGKYNLEYVYPLKFGKQSIWHDGEVSVSLNWHETYTYISDSGSKTFTLNPYGLKLTSGNYTGTVDDGSILSFDGATNNYVFTEEGLVYPQENTYTDDGERVRGVSVPVNDDEVILSQALYNVLFDEDFVVAEGLKEDEQPKHIGETISFSLMDGDKEVITISNKKLIGVFSSILNSDYSEIKIITSEYSKFQEYSYPVLGKVFKVTKDTESDLTEWRKEGIMFSGQFAAVAYQRERDFEQLTSFAGLASAILGVLSVLAVVSFVSLRIRESKKEIGIMRAVGVSRGELYFIFLGGTLLSAVIAFIIANIGVVVAVPMINAAYVDALFPELNFLFFTFLSELSGIAAGLLLPFVCAVIPIARIISRPPVKLLRV